MPTGPLEPAPHSAERGWPSSPHFKPREFACPHCGEIKVVRRLLEALEELRRIIGRPITITSGYRCPTHNQQVGGVPRSQHLTGRAADIGTARATVQQAVRAGFTGIGDKDGYVIHADVRASGPARWSY